MRFAVQHEMIALEEVDDRDRRVIQQPEFPERDLVSAFLPVAGIEIDHDHDRVAAVRREAGESDDCVVPRIEEQRAADIMQRRVFAPDAV